MPISTISKSWLTTGNMCCQTFISQGILKDIAQTYYCVCCSW